MRRLIDGESSSFSRTVTRLLEHYSESENGVGAICGRNGVRANLPGLLATAATTAPHFFRSPAHPPRDRGNCAAHVECSCPICRNVRLA